MIIEATAGDFEALLKGRAPGGLRLISDGAIAPTEVLEMLRGLADQIRPAFAPSAWFIIAGGEVVGLCSITRPPNDGEVHIGYGVGETRQGRGYARQAIADVLAWGRADPRVLQISAETGDDNIPSQRVLQRNGFVRIGTRIDAEDGPVICWRASTS